MVFVVNICSEIVIEKDTRYSIIKPQIYTKQVGSCWEKL